MEYIRKIHVYNQDGNDTSTIICYSKKEKRDEMLKLIAAGYTKKRDDKFPSRVFEIR